MSEQTGDERAVMTWGEPGASRLDAFVAAARERYGHELADYAQLHRWSCERPEEFWGLVWDHFGVEAARPYEEVTTGGTMPDVRWFTGRAAQLRRPGLPSP